MVNIVLFTFQGKTSSKLEDSRNKYTKSSTKLHRAHNEYILLLREVTQHQKNYLNQTLPSLLDHQQTCQENFIKQW